MISVLKCVDNFLRRPSKDFAIALAVANFGKIIIEECAHLVRGINYIISGDIHSLACTTSNSPKSGYFSYIYLSLFRQRKSLTRLATHLGR